MPPKARAASAAPKAAAAAADSAPGQLLASQVFVRIRPLAVSGGHADDGSGSVAKILEGYDEESVTIATQYMFSKGESRYNFPQKVLGPETSQQAAYDEMLPGLVDAFTMQRANVLFFAYGQTGTGKTRTMFGTEASLETNSFHDDWGIFPRVCHDTFNRLGQCPGLRFVLTASAIEFYLSQAFDLLNRGNPVEVDFETHMSYGETCIELTEPGDVVPFIQRIIANRTTRSTNFNQAAYGDSGEQHSGSSRSHAMLTLNLMQLDTATGEFVKTTFTLADLAGAERPSKTEDCAAKNSMSPELLPSAVRMMKEGQASEKDFAKGGKYEIPLGFQAQVINWELSSLSLEVLKATAQHKKGKPYAPPKSGLSPAIQFLTAIMSGWSRLGMVITLSSSPQNGWETWFSMQYGTELSKLRVPIRSERTQPFAKLLAKEEATALKLAKELESAPQNRYFMGRKMKAEAAMENLRRLRLLEVKIGGDPTGVPVQGGPADQTETGE